MLGKEAISYCRGLGNSVLLPSLCQKVNIDKVGVAVVYEDINAISLFSRFGGCNAFCVFVY